MKTTSVTYTIRVTLGQYQHEELSATVEPDPEKSEPGDKLMAEARKICILNTTAKKKEQK